MSDAGRMGRSTGVLRTFAGSASDLRNYYVNNGANRGMTCGLARLGEDDRTARRGPVAEQNLQVKGRKR